MKEKVSLITLGCAKNQVDSERLRRQLLFNNFRIAEQPDEADIIIINTCGFIADAKEESVDTILQAVDLKKSGRVKKVIVAGCLSGRYKQQLEKEIPEADAYAGVEAYAEILDAAGGKLKNELLGERDLTLPSHTAYLKISEGCSNSCSFCAIPLIRGAHKSRPVEQLLDEAAFLAEQGVKELIIIAQDTTDYGKDIYGKRALAELLNKLSGVEGIHWIRLMYTFPSHLTDDVLDEIANNSKIVKYIDIPIQHISDNVLKSMQRGITGKRTRDILNKIREKIPGVTVRTSIITGYPAETEENFNELYNFLKEFKFDRLGVFEYSHEEDTTAFKLDDIISESEKRRRKDELMRLQMNISEDVNLGMRGREIEVLVEDREDDYYIARSYRDAPEIDGEVFIPAENIALEAGSFYNVVVFDSTEYDLYAEFL